MTSIRIRTRGGRRFGLSLATGSAWLLLAVSPLSALAQGFGPDPFRPFNSQYNSYVYPISPGPLDPVGNPGLNRAGVRGANQFEDYLNGLGAGSNRYDQLYRSQISSHRRAFRPSREADAEFEDRQNLLTELYFRYLRERDPAKRAALLKEYTKARKGASRTLSAGSRAAAGRSAQQPNPRAAAATEGDAGAAMEGGADDAAAERVVSPRRRTSGRASRRARRHPPAAADHGISRPSLKAPDERSATVRRPQPRHPERTRLAKRPGHAAAAADHAVKVAANLRGDALGPLAPLNPSSKSVVR